jgi:hypothetical protein
VQGVSPPLVVLQRNLARRVSEPVAAFFARWVRRPTARRLKLRCSTMTAGARNSVNKICFFGIPWYYYRTLEGGVSTPCSYVAGLVSGDEGWPVLLYKQCANSDRRAPRPVFGDFCRGAAFIVLLRTGGKRQRDEIGIVRCRPRQYATLKHTTRKGETRMAAEREREREREPRPPKSHFLSVSLVGFMVVAGLLPEFARAEPVQWSGNGHWYEAVLAPSGNISWTDAQATATSAGGYLACITSVEENSFVFGIIANNEDFWVKGYLGPWLGGYQDQNAPGYSEPAGGWRWLSGENWNYTNWNSGEPNNAVPVGYAPGEDRVQFWGRSGGWNDAPNDIAVAYSESTPGYIVEFVPEPSSLVLLGAGAIRLLAYVWRRRRPTA